MHMPSNRKTLYFKYALDNRTLASVNIYQYQGVILSCDLTWRKHVDYVRRKALRYCGTFLHYFSRLRHQSKSCLTQFLWNELLSMQLRIGTPGKLTWRKTGMTSSCALVRDCRRMWKRTDIVGTESVQGTEKAHSKSFLFLFFTF